MAEDPYRFDPERFREAWMAKGFRSERQFAEEIGSSPSRLNDFARGQTGIGADMLHLICDRLGCSKEWLQGKDVDATPETAVLAHMARLSSEDRRAVAAYAQGMADRAKPATSRTTDQIAGDHQAKQTQAREQAVTVDQVVALGVSPGPAKSPKKAKTRPGEKREEKTKRHG